MKKFMFKYVLQIAKVEQIVEARTLTDAIHIFLYRKSSQQINDAVSFNVTVIKWRSTFMQGFLIPY